ncbi:hypothetical protein KP509_03G012400 [Ceratopteris richardii]|uniref:Uncharacterized protein n=1 Tax=Ceratopteris richardii TaxID=49495 RepID=A0A8T2V530_CERRI|nr:hypothetical protein KP509_03G012400 [Ceratopteris richardii]
MGDKEVMEMETICSSKEGPVLTVINKRLRALKKKYNRILQIEENKAHGKHINKEQEDLLRNKLAVGVLIEEYERLRPNLMKAVKEEIAKEITEFRSNIDQEKSIADENFVNVLSKEKEIIEHPVEESVAYAEIPIENTIIGSAIERNAVCDEKAHDEEPNAVSEHGDSQASQTPCSAGPGSARFEREVNDLLHLLYFAQLFDVRLVSLADAPPFVVWTKAHERISCVSYDYISCVSYDSTSPLEEDDLTNLAFLGSLITSRRPNATLSHQDAIKQCMKHALLWLENADTPIKDDPRVTYSYMRERLNRILFSEYYTMVPELQMFAEVVGVSMDGEYTHKILIHPASLAGTRPLLHHGVHGTQDAAFLHGEHNSPFRNVVQQLNPSQI